MEGKITNNTIKEKTKFPDALQKLVIKMEVGWAFSKSYRELGKQHGKLGTTGKTKKRVSSDHMDQIVAAADRR